MPTRDGTVNGTSGNDLIGGSYVDHGGDRVDGGNPVMPGRGEFDDHVSAGGGNDTVFAGEGNDTIDGGFGQDQLHGEAGDDVISGGDGNDVISGGSGDDTLQGDGGADTIDGGDGNDLIYGGSDPSAAPEGLEVWVNDQANLYRLDFDSEGVATKTLIAPTARSYTDIGMNSDGQLYGTDFGALYRIDTETGAETYLGTPGGMSGGNSLSFGPDGMGYTNGGSTIYRFDPNGGADANGVMPSSAWWTNPNGGASAGDFLFVGDTAYISWVTNGVPQLLRLGLDAEGNVISHEALGVLPGDAFGLAAGPNGEIYTVAHADGADGLYRIQVPSEPIDGGTGQLFYSLVDGSSNSRVYWGATSNHEARLGSGSDEGDQLSGGAGNDTIHGLFGDDVISGGIGDDSLFGGDGDDFIEGDAGNDTLFGDAGNDTIFGGDGADLVYGGEGDDALLGDGGNDTLFGGSGNDEIDGGEGDDSLEGGEGNDSLYGDAGDDIISGGNGDDRIEGGSGDDSISGDAGNDTIYGGLGEDQIYGGDGDDLIFGDADRDTIFGGSGNDTLYGGDGDDLISAGSTGNNLVEGGDGNDTIVGGEEADSLHGNADDDEIRGEGGDDQIYGGEGHDTLYGGTGNDTIYGEEGDDQIYGDAGNDTLFGGAGNDQIHGGEGDDSLEGGEGDDSLYGGGGNDTLVAGGGVNLLDGGDGDDLLIGGTGNDFIFGGAGDDTISVTDTHGGYNVWGGTTGETNGDLIDASTMTLDTVVHLGSNEEGTLTSGGSTINFHSIENIHLGSGNDQVFVDVGVNGFIRGGDGNDTLVLPEDIDSEVFYTGETENPDGSISYNGYVIFADGSRLDFEQFEKIEVPCFTPGTLIDTAEGPMPVEELMAGDRVLTRDHGFCELVWSGRRRLPAGAAKLMPHLVPVRIARGALGAGLPARDLLVSPGHRVLLAGARAEVMFGERELLVAAGDLLGMPGISQDHSAPLDYIHIMFERHEIIRSEGAWTESFQPSQPVLDAMGAQSRREIIELFPELEGHAGQAQFVAARPVLSASEVQMLLA